jgi:hypothetical protein
MSCSALCNDTSIDDPTAKPLPKQRVRGNRLYGVA